MIKGKGVFVLFILSIFLLCIFGRAQAMERMRPGRCHGQVGETVPRIILPRLDGKFFASSELQGKVVIFDFWATWHPPCRSAIPAFIELYNKYGEEKFEIIGICLDKDMPALKQFAHEIQINYPIAIGSKSIERSFGGIKALPTTLLVDKRGRIRFRFTGYTPKEVFEEKIKFLLRE
ncbi:MAG: TlpA disulfide reductase family protein [Candidatus Ratteibacteria bacterium]|nr:TlpA disulfide reductase family protein [Candidatus Ratteibacteria bacterium]